MNKIVIGNNQNIFDIALQEFGSIEAVFDILEDNQDIINGITDNIIVGTEFNIREISNNENKSIKTYYKQNKIQPASGDELIKQEGVC